MSDQVINLAHLANAKTRTGELDRQINDCLHMLEDLSLNAAQLVKVAARLRDLRRERRYWRELWILQNKIGAAATKGLAQWITCRKEREVRYKNESEESAKRLFG
ncbi:protein of unknown function [Pseudodesulfovibrio profundus]|uniref:Uncharacterized protein n=1 Tax=Pseudodesulfovibrio profundus TaxID=57320 RepID=A0A2C8FCW0_9BACT|nr:hypothetical protein [Pseudodesulfovibrio profundus]SOB60614.1 protein of unknown function [Pseudodesulfovibrio profundus]